jgi:two-component system chemotaxis response regulator CheY
MTIMAVDDSASMRQLIAFTIRGAGYEVVEAVDGADALKKLSVGGISMLIADVNMPGMEGIELVRRVRHDPAYRYIPIILLTTESGAQRRQEGRLAGATGWMVKPFRPDDLVAVVRKVLGKSA